MAINEWWWSDHCSLAAWPKPTVRFCALAAHWQRSAIKSSLLLKDGQRLQQWSNNKATHHLICSHWHQTASKFQTQRMLISPLILDFYGPFTYSCPTKGQFLFCRQICRTGGPTATKEGIAVDLQDSFSGQKSGKFSTSKPFHKI